MGETITVNQLPMDWVPGLSLYQVFREAGYSLKVPMVLVRVNGETVVKAHWAEYQVPAGADVVIRNVFCGG